MGGPNHPPRPRPPQAQDSKPHLTPMVVASQQEPWAIVTLANGDRIQIRVLIGDVMQQVGATDVAGRPVSHLPTIQMQMVLMPAQAAAAPAVLASPEPPRGDRVLIDDPHTSPEPGAASAPAWPVLS